MRRRILMAFLILFASGALAGPDPAAEEDLSAPGALRVETEDGVLVDMPLKHTHVSVTISAFVARVVIEQVFENPFERPVEAVYSFPLPDRAAVDDFEFVIGNRTIRGEIHRREEARELYERARTAGYRAALLEQERPNIFTQSVANLEPGREVVVRIRTFQTLDYAKGIYDFTFPLVVGPRYVPGGAAPMGSVTTTPVAPTPDVPDADRITPPVLRPGYRSGHDVEIEVALEAGVPVRDLHSPSHRILTEHSSPTSASVRLASDDTIPNKDFILRWSVSSERPAVGLLTHRDGVDGFFALLIQPKGEVSVEEAAPKQIIFVLDTSGSMSGVPIEASKRFVKTALRTLGRRDTFNLVRFSGSAETFSTEPVPNDSRSVSRALQWIEHLRGGGGTEMLAGFRAAFERPADPDRLRMVVFLTDGYIGNEHQILAAIGEVVGGARIFTLGIGSSVNHYLLDRMAEIGRGAYVFVRPDGRQTEAVDHFRGWVTRPYLTDLEVDWGALPVADLVPGRLPDLYSGQTLKIVGRYLGAGEGEIVLRGKLGGRYWEQKQRVVLPHRRAEHATLASLWGRHRIAEIMSSVPGRVTDSIRAEVTALALEYRLMSPFTSFLAVDDSEIVNPGGEGETVHQAVPLPEGVSFWGVFGCRGPRALVTEASESEIVPEDWALEAPAVRYEERERARIVAGKKYAAVVGGVSNTDPLAARRLAEARSDEVREVEVVSAGAGVEFGRAQGGFANVPTETSFSDEFVADAPVQGRFYTRVLTLAPGAAGGIHHGAEERDVDRLGTPRSVGISEPSAAFHLRDAALRVLADLAEDGVLSPAEGRPALAALMAAQTPEGAVAHDVRVHALAAWALAEAAGLLADDPWVTSASEKAVAYLTGLVGDGGWPGLPGGEPDAEATRWSRLVLHWVLGEKAPDVATPAGEPSETYLRLREAIASARSGAPVGTPAGRTPFDRLIGAVGRGHLGLTG